MSNNKTLPKHSVYYKSAAEKEAIDKKAEAEDISSSKYIYKILKAAGCFEDDNNYKKDNSDSSN